MYKDVEKFNKTCKICIRNDRYLTRHHPAFCNRVPGLQHEISIDFVWGLDETLEGYKGVIVIEEQLSKFVEIYCLKTKEKDKIALSLINYFCTYGPASRIMSDNEPSLISESINQLKVSIGVEWHKTVAAYSPQHNGLIERFVQTFSNTLRKLTEKDSTKWNS